MTENKSMNETCIRCGASVVFAMLGKKRTPFGETLFSHGDRYQFALVKAERVAFATKGVGFPVHKCTTKNEKPETQEELFQ